jgi:hypothetical protein
VIGVEGLYWAEAEQRGLLDAGGRFTTAANASRTRPRGASEVFAVLGMNERVERFLTRFAFGGEANAFRHGRLDPIGPRHQCLVWLVALAACIDGWGWPRPQP